MKKILLIANAKYTVTHFRGELLEALTSRGHSVKIAAPLGVDLDGSLVERSQVLPIRLDRKGIHPFKDLILILDLVKIIRRERPDIVLNFTIKPVIYGSIAAGLLGVSQVFSNMTGLGYVFTDPSKKALLLKKIVTILYRLALKFNERVFFQNPDDLKLFTSLGILPANKAQQLNGSGICIEKIARKEKSPKKASSFLFIGRLLRDKGLLELLDAFQIVQSSFPEANLTIIGEADTNPNSFSEEQIEKWKKDQQSVTFTGRINQVESYLYSHQVFVLPSYREGTPRAVLEAMAAGLPIITTDAPGCRETVHDGNNGFLVPIKNSQILAERMMFFLRNPKEIERMGEASFRLVQEKFDVHAVNGKILQTLNLENQEN